MRLMEVLTKLDCALNLVQFVPYIIIVAKYNMMVAIGHFLTNTLYWQTKHALRYHVYLYLLFIPNNFCKLYDKR